MSTAHASIDRQQHASESTFLSYNEFSTHFRAKTKKNNNETRSLMWEMFKLHLAIQVWNGALFTFTEF